MPASVELSSSAIAPASARLAVPVPALPPTAGLAIASGHTTGAARVMGSAAHVSVAGPPGPAAVLCHLSDLERRWSRFSPTSELSRLSAASPAASLVSPETAELVSRLLWAYEASGGVFDPCLAARLSDLGYDRDFTLLPSATADGAGAAPPAGWSAPGAALASASVSPSTGLVVLPSPVSLDPGGLGKGLAADLAAVSALDGGASSVLVSVGGDVRCAGEPPAGGWVVELEHGGAATRRVAVAGGAVVTSSVLHRRWASPSGAVHHVLDPRSGLPSSGPFVSVSVLAPEAWVAEVLATVLLVDGATDGPGPWGSWCALASRRDGSQVALGPEAAVLAEALAAGGAQLGLEVEVCA